MLRNSRRNERHYHDEFEQEPSRAQRVIDVVAKSYSGEEKDCYKGRRRRQCHQQHHPELSSDISVGGQSPNEIVRCHRQYPAERAKFSQRQRRRRSIASSAPSSGPR